MPAINDSAALYAEMRLKDIEITPTEVFKFLWSLPACNVRETLRSVLQNPNDPLFQLMQDGDHRNLIRLINYYCLAKDQNMRELRITFQTYSKSRVRCVYRQSKRSNNLKQDSHIPFFEYVGLISLPRGFDSFGGLTSYPVVIACLAFEGQANCWGPSKNKRLAAKDEGDEGDEDDEDWYQSVIDESIADATQFKVYVYKMFKIYPNLYARALLFDIATDVSTPLGKAIAARKSGNLREPRQCRGNLGKFFQTYEIAKQEMLEYFFAEESDFAHIHAILNSPAPPVVNPVGLRDSEVHASSSDKNRYKEVGQLEGGEDDMRAAQPTGHFAKLSSALYAFPRSHRDYEVIAPADTGPEIEMSNKGI